MCGIAGIASSKHVASTHVLAAACDSLAHRGPDDSGVWWSDDGRVGLGHRRLAIIDLSPAGHQPMADASGRLMIVFNGEIYNYRDLRAELASLGHRFRSASDTEVILEAYREWGEDCLTRLNGMFALAIFDAKKQQVFLARDRAGEKPLFYSIAGGTLRFASELKGILADRSFPREVDPSALDCYLAMGYVPGDRCMIRGINKLPAAHALVFCLNTGQARVRSYWRLPELTTSTEAADDVALLAELESLLEDSVRRQLVADVPVGVLLSGGVDSSLVTAMAVRSEAQVRTFTVRFPGHGAYDETEHARLVSRHFGTEHVELTAPESTVDLLPMLAAQFDEPMADSSMIPTFLVSRMIRQHCAVALGGDGGDELFGGYPHYPRLLWTEARSRYIPRPLQKSIARLAQTLLPIGFKGRNWLAALATDLRTGLPLIGSLFDRPSRARLLREMRLLPAETIRESRIPKTTDLLQRATRMDFENYLVEDILVKVDRASMLNSLEVRAPFLDHRIIEFAFAKVPSALKATSGSRKVLLKTLARRLFPASFDSERKQGFSIPLSEWMRRGPWHDYARDVLLGANDGPFERSFVQELIEGQTKGRANSERIFSLVLFELWRRTYDVSVA